MSEGEAIQQFMDEAEAQGERVRQQSNSTN
jgi:hypothetical protein